MRERVDKSDRRRRNERLGVNFSLYLRPVSSRRYIDRLGYDNRFTIYDTDDQKTLMKDICHKLI